MTDLARLPPITRALQEIPNGKRGAFLLGVTTDGVEVGFHAKLNETWTVEAGASWAPGEQVLAGVTVKACW